MTQHYKKNEEGPIPFALATVQVPLHAGQHTSLMLPSLFLDEGTPILVGGFMLLGGAVALFGLATYSTISSTSSRGIRALSLLVLWVMTGAASLVVLLPGSPPWLVVVPLLFFGTSCYASYQLATARQ